MPCSVLLIYKLINMKKIFFLIAFLFCYELTFSKADKVAPGKGITIPKQNFVVGLSKVSGIQLKFIKSKFIEIPAITSAEFVFGDNLLLIETNPNDETHVVSYLEIKKILSEYFNENDIYEKDHSFYNQLKSEHQKHDKYFLK